MTMQTRLAHRSRFDPTGQGPPGCCFRKHTPVTSTPAQAAALQAVEAHADVIVLPVRAHRRDEGQAAIFEVGVTRTAGLLSIHIWCPF